MRTITTILSTLFLAAFVFAFPTAQDSPGQPVDDGCFVPQVIFSKLDYEFTLVVRNTSFPKIDRQILSYIQEGEGYNIGIYPNRGQVLNSTLSDGNLVLDDSGGAKAFLVVPFGRPAFLRVAFGKVTETSLQLEAYYKCIDGKAAVVLRPVGDLVFCMYPDNDEKEGDYGLWVGTTIGDPRCITATVVVTDGVRPLEGGSCKAR